MGRPSKPKQKCTVNGCPNLGTLRTLCEKHYARFKRYGDPNIVMLRIDKCTIENCNEPHLAFGFCNKHYLKYKKYGDPSIGNTNEKHGDTNTKLYNLWCDIKKRCFNENNSHYKYYGKRGISVYPNWVNSYLSFRGYILNSIGEPPKGMTLGRKDNNKNYEPGNLQWEDYPTQNRNRRSNIILTYKGKTKVATDWALEYGIKIPTFFSRLQRGWPIDKILETPIKTLN